MKRLIVLIPVLFLCVAGAQNKSHPLQLVVPNPGSALRLAHYKTYPDEMVVDKVKSLERVAREANPNAKRWSIYLTPQAATIPIKGWKANLNTPFTPSIEATLYQCLRWLCGSVPSLRYEVLDGRILIDVKEKKPKPTIGSRGKEQPD